MPAGWYPGPNGNQQYWDGHSWQVPSPALGPPITQDAMRAAMAENRSIWVTNGLAAWALIAGVAALLCDFFCGAGVLVGAIGAAVGFVALNRSKQSGHGRNLALAGLITSGVAFLIGAIVLMVMFGSLATL
jgi:hypothetical protein